MKRYLGSQHWLEWGHKVHLQGTLASPQCDKLVLYNSDASRGSLKSRCSGNVEEDWEGMSLAFRPVSVPFIRGLLLRSKHFGETYWDRWADKLMPSVYIIWTPEFLLVSNETSAIVMLLGTSLLIPWLLEVFRIWKEASFISCSRNPAVSCPLCKLPVNEWAGHLTPWGSTSGSSDHQLLCLELSHAPVGMMNPECKCKALTSLCVSLASLLASNM